MNRRHFLQTSAGLVALAWRRPPPEDKDDLGQVVTVGGPIAPHQLGRVLPHEHVLVDFIGASQVNRNRYDADEVFRVALPHLLRARQLGCQTLVECTPAYLGRDPALLERLAKASGLHILTNTGYYGAVNGKYLPAHAISETADELAARWVRESNEGIDDTGIRPGFIKIGVDAGPLTEVNRKLVQAAARTHLQSGLTVAAHTGDGTAALEELELLHREGVNGNALIWVHAQSELDTAMHARAADQGVWVEFDGIGPQMVERHVELVMAMKRNGSLGRVLVSHDAGWYHVGEPGGGDFRSYDTLFADFLPALHAAGVTDAEIRQLTIDNPREAFKMHVRAKRQ